jgi:hypothetical protein
MPLSSTWIQVRRSALLGLAIGLACFALLLAKHVYEQGGLHPHLGCVIGLEQRALNAPAALLRVVVANRVIAPQTYGDERPIPGSTEDLDAAWSPAAFAGWGAICFGAIGLLVGAGIGAARTRLGAARGRDGRRDQG